MEAVMEQMKLKNIDKSDWTRYRFDEIAKNVSERVDPNKTDLTTYIGLEHIDSENIHITRSGTPDDVNGTKLRFYKGDIIFGRRRAYQRKAGIADCDGFCSAHALVLRATPDVIHPKLFPFFMHSDAFMDCAVNISVGSLSPTINWGTLKSQEFLLPPPEEQEKLAELLWAMDEVIQREIFLLEKIKKTYHVKIEAFVPKSPTKYLVLKELVSIRKGVTYKSDDYSNADEGLPLLNLKSIERGGGFNKAGIKYYNGPYKESHIVKNEDLIIACTDITRDGNVVGYPLHPTVYQNMKMLFTMDLLAINVINPLIDRDYLYYFLKANWVHRILFAHSPGTTVLHLDIEGLNKLKIPLFTNGEQNFIVMTLRSIEETISATQLKIKSSKALQKSMINQIF